LLEFSYVFATVGYGGRLT